MECITQSTIRKAFQAKAGVQHVSAVILAHVKTKGEVLHPSQRSIRQVLVDRHPPLQRRIGQHARTLHDVGLAVLERRQQLGQQLRRVLAVGVQQRNDVGALLQRMRKSGLLGLGISLVTWVLDQLGVASRSHKSPYDLAGPVGAAVVDHQDPDDFAASSCGSRRKTNSIVFAAWYAGITIKIARRAVMFHPKASPPSQTKAESSGKRKQKSLELGGARTLPAALPEGDHSVQVVV